MPSFYKYRNCETYKYKIKYEKITNKNNIVNNEISDDVE